jgi:hypothetical protein
MSIAMLSHPHQKDFIKDFSYVGAFQQQSVNNAPKQKAIIVLRY